MSFGQDERTRRCRVPRGFLATVIICGLPLGQVAAQTISTTPAVRAGLDPVGTEIETNRAILDFEHGQHDEVLRRLEKLGPNGLPRAAYYRGLSLLSLKRAQEALGQFEAVRRQPGAPTEVDLDRALAHLSLGDAAKAQEILQGYIATRPNDPYGRYFLGVALFRQKQFDAASAEFDRVATDTTLAPYLDFYRGLTSYAQGGREYGRFLEQFRGAFVEDGPRGETADLTHRLLATSGGPKFQPGRTPTVAAVGPNGVQGPNPDRRWNLAVLSGYDYDTNVALVPSLAFTPVGLGSRGQSRDSRWTIASFGDFRLVQNDDWVLGLIGSTYDTWQFNLSRYNFQDYMGGLYSNVALGPYWIFGTRYEFHESLLGGKQFATDHRLTPNITLREGAVGHTTAYYEFEALDITGIPVLVPAQNRSGTINSVGVTQAFYLMNGAGRLFLGYRYDRANTRGSDFDRETNQLDARLEVPLPWKTVANIECRYFFNNYLHPNSLDFFAKDRRDRTVEARAGAQKFFTRNLSLLIEYIYTNNDSNVKSLFGASPFTYQRNVLSTMLIYDF